MEEISNLNHQHSGKFQNPTINTQVNFLEFNFLLASADSRYRLGVDVRTQLCLTILAFRTHPGPRKRPSLPASLALLLNLDAACPRTTGDSRKVTCQSPCHHGQVSSNSRNRPKI